MIEFTAGSVRFNYRVAGICIRDDHVLLHREVTYDIWALPGGRLHLLEPSPDALRREMDEEMQLAVTVGRLIWVVENFFQNDDFAAGVRFHEIGLYYEMSLPSAAGEDDVHADFMGHEGDVPIIFRWFPVDRLSDVALYPAFLRSALVDLPDRPVHVIHRDTPDT